MKRPCADGWLLESQARVAHNVADIVEVHKAHKSTIAVVTREKDALQISQRLYLTKIQLRATFDQRGNLGLRDYMSPQTESFAGLQPISHVIGLRYAPAAIPGM